MRVEAKLKEMGIELPSAPSPAANYVPAVRTGNLLFVSGVGPADLPELAELAKKRGPDGILRVGRDLTTEEGYKFARATGVSLIARLKGELGDLDRVKRVVKLLAMINSAPEFKEHPRVINGCSDLLVEVFGDAGRHARSAVGLAALPNGIPVEIEMIVEVE